jgi:hypothetical protein
MGLSELTSAVIILNIVILLGLSLSLIIGFCILGNNLLHKFWKPITIIYHRDDEKELEDEYTKQSSRQKKDPSLDAGDQR